MPMLVLRPRSVLERVLDATKVLLLPGLAWALASAAALLAPPPAPAWATLAPPLAVVALLALAWRRSAATRRALEAGAVTTSSGHRLLPPRHEGDPVRLLAAPRLDVGQAAREYAAEVHVPRGDRESLDLGRCERVAGAPARFTLELTTALGGREVLVFDCTPLLAASGARPARTGQAG